MNDRRDDAPAAAEESAAAAGPRTPAEGHAASPGGKPAAGRPENVEQAGGDAEVERERKSLTGIEGGEPPTSDRVLSSKRALMSYEMVERGPLLSAAVGTDAPRGMRRADRVRPRDLIEDPDRELVVRWQAGDEDAFEQLVRRHEKKVFRLLLRMMGSREEAQDVAQETFLSLHRHGHRFRGDARFSTFLYRVASNAALNRRRTLGRNRARIQKLAVRQAAGDDLPSSPRNPEDAAVGGDLTVVVRKALDSLKPALRLPVVLYDIEGLAYGEIAKVMGVAEGTVKSRIHRARQALRKELQTLLADSSDASGSVAGPRR